MVPHQGLAGSRARQATFLERRPCDYYFSCVQPSPGYVTLPPFSRQVSKADWAEDPAREVLDDVSAEQRTNSLIGGYNLAQIDGKNSVLVISGKNLKLKGQN